MFNILTEIELESYVSEFETAVSILEYYMKEETMCSYVMEGMNTPTQQPNAQGGQTQPTAGQPTAQPQVNSSVPSQTQTQQPPTPQSQTQPNPTAQASSSQPPKTAAQIMASTGTKTEKKKNILQRMIDALKAFWAKLTEKATDKASEQRIDSAISEVEQARSEGISVDEFFEKFGDSIEKKTDNPETAAKLKEFYTNWFQNGTIPTHMSKESVQMMNSMIKYIDEMCKALPRYSAYQIQAEGKALAEGLSSKADMCIHAFQKQIEVKPSVWKTYFFMAGDMSRKMTNAFDNLQKVMNQLYQDPEKGPAMEQVFGNISGPLKNMMNAAKMMNQELNMVTLSSSDKTLAEHKGMGGQRLFGSQHHVYGKGKNEAVKEGKQNYEEKLRASGDYSEKEIKHLVNMAQKEFGKGYNKEFNRTADESTEKHDLRNLAKKTR